MEMINGVVYYNTREIAVLLKKEKALVEGLIDKFPSPIIIERKFYWSEQHLPVVKSIIRDLSKSDKKKLIIRSSYRRVSNEKEIWIRKYEELRKEMSNDETD